MHKDENFKLQRENQFKLHAFHFHIIHLPQLEWVSRTLQEFPYTVQASILHQNPTKASSKSMKNLENKGALQETPCMHDNRLL